MTATAVQVAYRGDTSTNVAAYTGPAREIIVDTTNNRAVIQDGLTAGGWAAAKLSEVVTNTRTAIADAAYTALITDRTIAYTSLTAARVVSLPTAASFPTGSRLLVVDESGSCSATITITLTPNGADTINGAGSAVIAMARGFVGIESNGSNKWTIVDQSQIANASLAPMATARIKGNVSGSTATPSDLTPAQVQSVAASPFIAITLRGLNINATGDTTIPVTLPTGFTRYRVWALTALNASIVPTLGKIGLYTAASQGGLALLAQTLLTAITTTATETAGAVASLSMTVTTAMLTDANLYLNVGTANGAACTVDLQLVIQPYS